MSHITAYSKPIRLVIHYIENHYTEKIMLLELAGHIHLSEASLSDLIKKETGMGLPDNINKIRIEANKQILLKSNISFAELASTVG